VQPDAAAVFRDDVSGDVHGRPGIISLFFSNHWYTLNAIFI
jgi:hypothetical protein